MNKRKAGYAQMDEDLLLDVGKRKRYMKEKLDVAFILISLMSKE